MKADESVIYAISLSLSICSCRLAVLIPLTSHFLVSQERSNMYLSAMITTLLSLALYQTTFAASPSDWASRSIYQVLTDRFARTDGSTTATCNSGDQVYCGGSWQGITNKLDYIQGMGFDAVWISPITAQVQGNTPDGSSYHGVLATRSLLTQFELRHCQ